MTRQSFDADKIAAQYGIPANEVRIRWLTLKVAQWKSDFRLFCRDVVKIRSKEGVLISLELNQAQEILHDAAEIMLWEEKWVRLIGLKGRRQGFSTYVGVRGYWRATLWDLQRVYILAHEMSGSGVLFDMVALMQDNHPFPPAVGTDNAKELEFVKRGSSYAVATAGQKAGGRGGAISYFHGSEVGYWTNASDHFASSVQAVDEVRGVWGILWKVPEEALPFEIGVGEISGWVKAPSEIFLESTSSGPAGEFYRRYMDAMSGKGRYRAVFVPWKASTEYSAAGEYTAREAAAADEISESDYALMHGLDDGQMLWRREKIQELGGSARFMQEYPCNVVEAFSATDVADLFIHPSLVMKARGRTAVVKDAPLVLGVDCAGAGGDRFAVAYRRGDWCEKVVWRSKLEHNDAIAWLSSILDEDKPARMCIDRGSMGAAIISGLRGVKQSYGEIVRGIDFGGTSQKKKALPGKAGPVNVRAEIYGRMREWMLEGGGLPDCDALASDLSATKIKYRSNNDWLLESKSDMKARGVRSPDLSDALALTFSINEWFGSWNKGKSGGGFAVGEAVVVSSDDSIGAEHGWMA
jgi:hypothetical protein